MAVAAGDLAGIKCASISGLGPAVKFGVVVGAGSRDELEDENGAAHMLRQLAFRSTSSASELKLFRDLESIGATTETAVTREYMLYSVTCSPEASAEALGLLSEAVMDPALYDYEGKAASGLVTTDLAGLAANKGATLIEAAHEAAYGFSGLGNSLYAADGLPSMDAVRGFYERALVADNMVLVGAGADMDVVSAAASTHFGGVAAGSKPATAASTFGSGDVRVRVPGAAETLFALSYGLSAAEAPAVKVFAELLNSKLPLGMTAAVYGYSDATLLAVSGAAESKLTGEGMEKALSAIKGMSVDDAGVAAAAAKLAVADAAAKSTLSGAVLPAALSLLHGAPGAADAASVKSVASKVSGMVPAVAAVGKASAVPRASELA
uniref:Peptidase M16 N-terminal domain-containing protein n=1 Tax=Phaeomonas parva TaxID=124430 RepID=A0A7S1UI62_9STRA